MTLILDEPGTTGIVPPIKYTVEQKIAYALAPFGPEQAWFMGLILEGCIPEIGTVRQYVTQFLGEHFYERLGEMKYTHGTGIAFQAKGRIPNFSGIIEVGSNDERLAIKYMTTRHPGSDLTRNGLQEEMRILKRAVPELTRARQLDYNNIDAILGGLVTKQAE